MVGWRPLRWLLGFVVAPPVAAVVGVIGYNTLWHAGLMSGGAALDSIDSARAFGFAVGILAVPMTLCAAPIVAWLNGRALLSFRTTIAVGAVLGNVPFLLIVLGIIAANPIRETLSGDISRFWYGAAGFLERVALGLACGTSAAAAFWTVGVRGQPRS